MECGDDGDDAPTDPRGHPLAPLLRRFAPEREPEDLVGSQPVRALKALDHRLDERGRLPSARTSKHQHGSAPVSHHLALLRIEHRSVDRQRR